MKAAKRSLRGIWLGRRGYREIYELQVRLRDERVKGERGDTLLLLEHDPVITFGRGGRPQNVLVPEATLARRGLELVQTDRGGDVTLHAPGQLVAYPVIDLKPDRCDVRQYVNDLAETMRCLIRPWKVDAGLLPGLVGLWVDSTSPACWPGSEAAKRPAKIGAIGVRISRWVTLHGFALNLSTELDLFDFIVPCGISQYGVTSVQQLTGSTPAMEEAATQAHATLARVLGAEAGELEDRSHRQRDALAGI